MVQRSAKLELAAARALASCAALLAYQPAHSQATRQTAANQQVTATFALPEIVTTSVIPDAKWSGTNVIDLVGTISPIQVRIARKFANERFIATAPPNILQLPVASYARIGFQPAPEGPVLSITTNATLQADTDDEPVIDTSKIAFSKPGNEK